MIIDRSTYLNRLVVRKHNGLIKVITGIRRCGKSFLLNRIFYSYLVEAGIASDHIIKFAFDSAEDLINIGEDPLLLNSNNSSAKANPEKFLKWILPQIKDDDMYYLLLDEVQLLDSFEFVLNGFLRRDNVDIYVTGSNSKFLSKDVITEFAGRGDEVHIMPLSFSEYYEYKGGNKYEAYEEYSIYGGLPAVALMDTEEQKTNHLISQMQTVYLKDIVYRYNLNDDSALSDVVDVVASGISSLTNPNKISNTFKSEKSQSISSFTVGKYLEYMEEAFIINRVRRFDIKGRKYIGSPFKIYFEDIGLRNARLNFRQIEQTHIMENIIYNELRYRGFQVDVGVVSIRNKDSKGKEVKSRYEIDFVATQGNRKYYIQSAFVIPTEEKYLQETNIFNKVSDSFKKVVIVDKTMKPRYDENGYLFVGLREFLLDENSLNY